jgi:hypothetical protein
MKGCLAAIGAIVVVFLVIGVIGAIVHNNRPGSSVGGSGGSAGSGGSPESVQPTNPTQPPKPSPPAEEIALDLAASDARGIFAEYKANEVRADNEMKDKWCLVKGVIGTIGKDITDTPYVTLKAEDVFGSVQCMFSNADEIKKVAELQPGQEVLIVGLCKGKLGNVLLRKCQMVGTETPKVGDKWRVTIKD